MQHFEIDNLRDGATKGGLFRAVLGGIGAARGGEEAIFKGFGGGGGIRGAI